MGEAANTGQLNIWLSFLRDLMPLIGLAVGAGLQYLFSRSGENKRHERALRLAAYAAYLQSV